ncbi:(2Fe-2S)-binding protein [Salisaeta longa]|uniref:(2Fe-2S)-binding protein n=1 Tax=Salisaeta longa TaxID=503170 RepID=UPI0003B46A26|nr:(2Fe-2S)-binding protein [Salisaeta longa]
MHIDRCYCFQKTFAELKAVAEATGAASVEALQAEAVFGHNCQLCHPYVRRMLRTGDTVFDTIVEAADEPPTPQPARTPSD